MDVKPDMEIKHSCVINHICTEMGRIEVAVGKAGRGGGLSFNDFLFPENVFWVPPTVFEI